MLKIMFKFLTITLFMLWNGMAFAGHHIDSLNNNTSESPKKDNAYTTITQRMINDSVTISYIATSQLYQQGWNTLFRPQFWQEMMMLPSDSCAINIGSTREIITLMSRREWDQMSDKQKDNLRDSIRKAHSLTDNVHIYRTKGKKKFYNFEGILSDISKGVTIFENQNVDPWYAQAILMIECPGKLSHSPAGAYGAFQLMPGIARKFGLTVNHYQDDRKYFKKSAIAASQLIATICIPEAKKILDLHNITYHPTDLWFRLFVLHIYNAGAYNVAGVVNKISPQKGGMQLIQKMWTTEARHFRNASQNYTQVALAALMILNKMVVTPNDYTSL